MKTVDLYKDIQARTNGEIYLGVVGPVRTGKSTFIKRFMDLMVLPEIEDEYAKSRTQDELPQSAQGKTIMTTEPKFIPKEAAKIKLDEDIQVLVRLIDCVGYMVEGAEGHIEGNTERLVKTPWSEQEISFTQAAEIGTRKVIHDHSTIGIVVTTDGSFSGIPRENYIAPEEKTIAELKRLGKPFVVILNSMKPYSDESTRIAEEISKKNNVRVISLNCQQIRKEDIHKILECVLKEFPVMEIEYFVPRWIETLPMSHPIKAEIIDKIRESSQNVRAIKDAVDEKISFESPYVCRMKLDEVDLASGKIKVQLQIADKYYYEMISEMLGVTVENEYTLLSTVRELARKKEEYQKVENAMQSVKMSGYGVVMPTQNEIKLYEPEIVKHGNKFGVKIRSEAPSIHMIRAGIETEIAPIVGSEQQAKDLIEYIKDNSCEAEGIWKINIFGKSVEQLVSDGINSKLSQIGEESQSKLQDTMQKVVNDSSGGMVCIII
ncbi:MAG: stage IV sporulation protein A [Lachnospiraceae bacterium]|nr:stage IV sporulation protein A [Lachnospiraceae bacterium]